MSTLTMPPPVGIPTFPVQKISVARYHQMIGRGAYSEDGKVERIEGYIVPKISQKPPHSGTVQNVEKKILRKLPTGWTTRNQAPISALSASVIPVALFKGMVLATTACWYTACACCLTQFEGVACDHAARLHPLQPGLDGRACDLQSAGQSSH